MKWTWVGAVCNAVGMFAVSWGPAGLLETGCAPSPRGGCAVPDGAGGYFAAFFVPPFLLAIPAALGLYAEDWRPTLGFCAGAPAGCAAVFSTGTSTGYWLLAAALLTFGSVTPLAARRYCAAAQRKARNVARQQEERCLARQRRTERRQRRGR
ncbi:hypothetical protein [Streptomyces sp. NPDC003247]|uniref:hypothetical protein n=1 Tax=Streptomyces sp. NPDC003247 TaxID=3364677 RepID=UPI0036ADC6B7